MGKEMLNISNELEELEEFLKKEISILKVRLVESNKSESTGFLLQHYEYMMDTIQHWV